MSKEEVKAPTQMWWMRPGERARECTKAEAQAIADKSGRAVEWAGMRLEPVDHSKYDQFALAM